METLANDGQPSSRFVASFVERTSVLKFSLEEQTFEDLEKTKERDLVVIGEKPSVIDRFIFGNLGGQYQVSQKDNKVVELHFTSPYFRPKNLPDRKSFLEKNLNLFSDNASGVRAVDGDYRPNGGDILGGGSLGENFEILSHSGQNLGQIYLILDKDYNLMSMKVEKL